ncbi:hypothetical protein P7H22_10705 [Paenibacillus larvae]|nr:hypothetical protein [Paenibacillus larvae]MDT2240713.1 hypothetical protein [Paenibacillus larvae]
MEKFFKINDDLIQLLSNAGVAITKHGDADTDPSKSAKNMPKNWTGSSQERSPPKQSRRTRTIKSAPKNTRLQLTMQISLSQRSE